MLFNEDQSSPPVMTSMNSVKKKSYIIKYIFFNLQINDYYNDCVKYVYYILIS